jgi:hypothetical protein
MPHVLQALLSLLNSPTSYTFDLDMDTIMYYATMIFNLLMPIGAIGIGINFGVGILMLLINVIKGSIRSIA